MWLFLLSTVYCLLFTAARSNRSNHFHQVTGLFDVVNPNDLNGIERRGVCGDGERSRESPAQRPIEEFADKCLPRHSKADRPLKPVKFPQAGDDVQIVFAGLTEAYARI